MYKYYNGDSSKGKFLDESAPSDAKRIGVSGLVRAAQFAPNIIGLPGEIQKATIGDLPGPLNVLSDISDVARKANSKIEDVATNLSGVKDFHPHGLREKIFQGVAGSAIPTLATLGGGAVLQGAKGLPGIIGGARAAISSQGIKQGAKTVGSQLIKNPLVKAIGADIAGSTGGTLGHEASFFLPDVARFPTSVASDFLFRNSFSKLGPSSYNLDPSSAGASNAKSVLNNVEKIKSDLGNVRSDLGSKIEFNGKPLLSKLWPFHKEIGFMQTGHGFKETESAAALNNVERLIGKIKDKKGALKGKDKKSIIMNGEDLYGLKRDINSVWNHEGTRAAQVQKRMYKIISEEIDKIGQNNPEWYKSLKDYDAIHGIQRWESGLTKFFKDNPKEAKLDDLVTSKVAQGAIMLAGSGIGYLKGGIGGLLTGGPLTYGAAELGKLGARKVGEKYDTVQKSKKLLEYVKNVPSAKKLLEDIAQDSIRYNETRNKVLVSSLKKNLHTFNRIAKDFEKQDYEYFNDDVSNGTFLD